MNRQHHFPTEASPAVPRRATASTRQTVKIISASLLASLAAPSLWALQPAVVKGDNVNVRGSASSAGEVLTKLKNGEHVQIMEIVNGPGAKKGQTARWAQIQLPASAPAYVKSSFLNGDTVAASELNVRGGPGNNFSIIGKLGRGDKVHSLGKKGEWVKISPTPETYAFVAAEYLVESSAPPVVASAPAGAAASPAPVSKPAPAQAPAAKPEPIPAAKPAVAAASTPAPKPAASTAPTTVPTPAAASATNQVSTPLINFKPAGVLTHEDLPTVQQKGGTMLVMDEPAAAPPPESASAATAKAKPANPSSAKPASQPASNPQPKTSPPQTAEAAGSKVDLQVEPNLLAFPPNRISLGYRFGLNNSAEFSGFASSAESTDGYVLPSSRQTGGPTPAPDGRTWNWGYNSPSQVQNGELLVTKTMAPASTGSQNFNDDKLASGIELTYARELWDGGPSKFLHFGVELALSYMYQDTSATWAHSVPTVQDVSAYALNGVVPPYDPITGATYQGTYSGPGPMIPLNSSSTTRLAPNPTGAAMSSYREISANTYGLRLGPYVEIPLYKRLWANAGGGMSLGLVDGSFNYRDQFISGVPNGTVSGSASQFSALLGWYISGGLSLRFSHYWGVFYSAQYQQLPDYTISDGPAEAKLKAASGFLQSVGLSYSF